MGQSRFLQDLCLGLRYFGGFFSEKEDLDPARWCHPSGCSGPTAGASAFGGQGRRPRLGVRHVEALEQRVPRLALDAQVVLGRRGPSLETTKTGSQWMGS